MSQPGEFEQFGGRHVPEPLEEPLEQLATAFDEIVPTAEFQERFQYLLKHYGGRPTPVYYAERLSEQYGADIYFKHEDLLHGGAHKLNNATTMVGALLDIPTKVYMGKKDMERQKVPEIC